MNDATHPDPPAAPPATVPPSLLHYRKTLLGRLDERFPRRPHPRTALAVLLAVILLVPSIQFIHRIGQIDRSDFREGGFRHRTALGRWLPTAEVLADDDTRSPYGYGHWFPTPPFVLMSLIPFAGMGYTAAGLVWALLKIACFLTAMALLVREFDRNGFPVPAGVLLMTALFALRPIISDIQHGNLNTFMMIWLALAWVLYIRGSDLWAGLFVALAVVTKITPALVLVYFLYKRAWRVCLGAAVGLALFFIILPGLYLGFDRNFSLLLDWFDMLVAPFALQGYATVQIANQSLYGVALRLLSNAGILSLHDMPTDQLLDAGMEFMARPATPLGSLLRPAISFSVVAVLAWLCRTRCPSRRDPRLLLEFALVLLAMLLLGERTWKHHGTTLPIVYLGVWYVLTCLPWSDRFRKWFVAGLIVQLVLLLGTSEGIIGKRPAELALDGGAFCWGLLLCFCQIALLLKAIPSPPKTPQTPQT